MYSDESDLPPLIELPDWCLNLIFFVVFFYQFLP
jgi:hypothetical protein